MILVVDHDNAEVTNPKYPELIISYSKKAERKVEVMFAQFKP